MENEGRGCAVGLGGLTEVLVLGVDILRRGGGILWYMHNYDVFVALVSNLVGFLYLSRGTGATEFKGTTAAYSGFWTSRLGALTCNKLKTIATKDTSYLGLGAGSVLLLSSDSIFAYAKELIQI